MTRLEILSVPDEPDAHDRSEVPRMPTNGIFLHEEIADLVDYLGPLKERPRFAGLEAGPEREREPLSGALIADVECSNTRRPGRRLQPREIDIARSRVLEASTPAASLKTLRSRRRRRWWLAFERVVKGSRFS